MAREFQAGASSKSILVFIRDTSVTASVAGLTGLVYNTASLTAYFIRPGEASATAITLATLATPDAAWSSGGFIEVDATDMPGWYRLDVPNAALASGAPEVGIVLKGAANMEQVNLTIDLTGYDPTAAASTVGDIAAAVNVVRKNVALANFMFKMVDATDLATAETGVTVTATRSIDGAAFAACANAAAEVSNGWYKIDLATTDLNGNVIVLRFTGTGCHPTEIVLTPQPTGG